MEFKIGDKVRVNNNSVGGYLRNKVGIVREVQECVLGVEFEGFSGHRLNDERLPNSNGWYVPKAAVTLLKKENKPRVLNIKDKAGVMFYVHKIIINEPAVVVFYEDDKGVERKSVAKCHPNDTFNEQRGVEVACAKAIKKAMEKIIRKGGA